MKRWTLSLPIQEATLCVVATDSDDVMLELHSARKNTTRRLFQIRLGLGALKTFTAQLSDTIDWIEATPKSAVLGDNICVHCGEKWTGRRHSCDARRATYFRDVSQAKAKEKE